MKLKNLIILLMLPAVTASAQTDRNASLVQSEKLGWEIEVKAGFRIGGTSPIPLPVEIREIKGYNPTLSIPVEAIVTKWLGGGRRWGVTSGLRLENRGMATKALVKNYQTEIIGDGGEIVGGHWTGKVKTKIRNTYITIPVLAAYRMNRRWTFRAGGYASVLTDGEFSGYVYDGYLREGDPTGVKVEFAADRVAAYDFSRELRRLDYGARLGASWLAFRHLNTFADLSWGLNSIFKRDFKTVTFAMYPIYADFGIGYVF
jgi:hypothetical protein